MNLTVQEEAEAIRQMQQSIGWEIVSKFINKKIEQNKKELMSCLIEDVIKHRAKVKAYESIGVHLSGILNLIEENEDA